MNVEELENLVLALLLMSTTDSGDDDWVVWKGILRVRSGKVFFDRGEKHPEFELDPEWLSRIKPTNETFRPILLDAPFYLSLTVGDVPEDEDFDTYRPTGLKWPK